LRCDTDRCMLDPPLAGMGATGRTRKAVLLCMTCQDPRRHPVLKYGENSGIDGTPFEAHWHCKNLRANAGQHIAQGVTMQPGAGPVITCKISCASVSLASSQSCHGSASPGPGDTRARCRSGSGRSSMLPAQVSTAVRASGLLSGCIEPGWLAAACAALAPAWRDTSCGVTRRGVDVKSDAADCLDSSCPDPCGSAPLGCLHV